MADVVVVRRGTYVDSVALMLASRQATAEPGVAEAVALAATPLNIDLVLARGFDLPGGLGPNDLLIAVRASSGQTARTAARRVEQLLFEQRVAPSTGATEPPLKSVTAAARTYQDLSLAVVAVPAPHAAYEVAQALAAGLNVFCFSAGIGLGAEATLKRFALERGLLLMGPDCGTAILDGVGLGFSNVVDRGPVGIVGASGTGTQEVCCLLDRAQVGVSHAIGVGGRDLTTEVGGAMTRKALQLLGEDPDTEVVVVVSKPPDPGVAEDVAKAAAGIGKPAILAFLGAGPKPTLPLPDGVRLVSSLEAAAGAAAAQAGQVLPPAGLQQPPPLTAGYIRGLFCGGSLCEEARAVVVRAGGKAAGHRFVDFGDESLVHGRAHPMIDPTLRNLRFVREAMDAEVGVVLLDVVLGRGAHPDPAGELAPLIEQALADRAGSITVVIALCGAARDAQNPEAQAARLTKAGGLVTRSAASAARTALAAAGVAR